MPGQLWDSATGLAEQLGARATANELGICYKSLSKRLESTTEGASLAKDTAPQFVQVHPLKSATSTSRVADSSSPIVLEVSGPTGQRLTLRLSSEAQLVTATALVRECWSQ